MPSLLHRQTDATSVGMIRPDAGGRIPALDGLRGLAILAVLAYHSDVLFGGQYGAPGNVAMSRALGVGWIGVQLFFVLSGYLITSILLERKHAHAAGPYYRGFYIRRALRILPLYYGFLTLYFVLLHRLPDLAGSSPLRPIESSSLFLFFYNLRAPGHPIPVLHMYWSLCIEEQFYLLWPLVVWYANRRWLGWICTALIVGALAMRVYVIAAGYGIATAYLVTPCVLDAPAIGALVAVLNSDGTLWKSTLRYAGPVAALAALAAIGIGYSQGHFYGNLDVRADPVPLGHDSRLIQTWGVTAANVCFAGILAFVLGEATITAKLLSRMLSWRVLRTVGFYSYAMYMFHRLVLHHLEYLGSRHLPGFATLPPNLAKPIAVLVLAAVCYGLARLSYILWERPFLRLRSRWAAD